MPERVALVEPAEMELMVLPEHQAMEQMVEQVDLRQPVALVVLLMEELLLAGIIPEGLLEIHILQVL
jgi:hypothetical protein